MPITGNTPSLQRTAIVLLCALIVSLAASLSAHVVKGLVSPTLATAFVSSPSSGVDAPIPIKWGTVDSGHRVVCFNVANTSPERLDRPGYPRVTAAGVELPGEPSGFTLLEPLDGNWDLVEGARVRLTEDEKVTLDFAIVARETWWSRRPRDPQGIPPGQAAVRGTGTRFCVSGPFPDEIAPGQATTIEQILNGVVVGFVGVAGNKHGFDLGVWDNAARIIPLFP